MNEINNRTLVFTGEGKGKTTAALGCVLRAAGHGITCAVIQFMKKETPGTGEIKSCRHLDNVDVTTFGLGFVPHPDTESFSRHREAAQQGCTYAADVIEKGEYGLVVLDEICGAVAKGLLTEKSVMTLMTKAKKLPRILILTGRSASGSMLTRADTVTEMRCVKHGMNDGIKAQPGVEL